MKIEVHESEGGSLLPFIFEFTDIEARIFLNAYQIARDEGWPANELGMSKAQVVSAIEKFRMFAEHLDKSSRARISLDEFPLLAQWYEQKKKGDSALWNLARGIERLLVADPAWAGSENLRARMQEIERLAPTLLDRIRKW
ncbi:MAG: hypothetical protein OXC08_20740 [Thiotrichales bacterium]|nr:hypothetical protein [Thiotrichales bacterium]